MYNPNQAKNYPAHKGKNILDFKAARVYALDILETQLSANLYYHSAAHTRDDVVPAAIWLARQENISEAETFLLLTAAWYHDVGYVTGVDDHETRSKRLAAQVLPRFSYTPKQITTIHRLIEATRVPQQPQTHLEEIIADADLDSLGREDFFETSYLLYVEMLSLGHRITPLEWAERQLNFLQTHTYFTTTAKTKREPVKQENINVLVQLLEKKRED